MNKIIGLFLLLNICSFSLMAQNNEKTKQQKAISSFYQGDMQEAIPLLQDLYSAKQSGYYYQYLLQSYVITQEYTIAHKLVKRHYKDKNNYHYLFDVAYLAKAKGQDKQAEKKYKAALKNMPPNKSVYVAVVNNMRRRALFGWAEQVYLYAQKHLPDESFYLELASLYEFLQKYKPMSDMLLSALEQDGDKESTIHYRFQHVWSKQSSDTLQEYVRRSTLKRLQKQPNKLQLRTFLLWMSVQQRDFEMAEIQARALDKRRQSQQDVSHLFRLTAILLNHEAYHQAEKILQQMVFAKDADKVSYYPELWRRYLRAAFRNVKHMDVEQADDMERVKQAYDFFGKHVGWIYAQEQTVIDYADLLAHYTHQADSAILFLKSSLSYLRLQPEDMGVIKLYLGDLYQEVEQPWEATLLYSQIEKDFPHDNLGFEARYRNALLSFYLGEIGWAEAQLDVLKAATDKKIANDAMKWALFITEAKAADTTQQLLRTYGRGLQAQSQGKDTLAISVLDTLLNTTDNMQLQAFFSLQKAKIRLGQQRKMEAKTLLESFTTNYSDSFVADEAIWTLIGLLKETESEQCQQYYKLLITQYPASFYTPQAREAYRKI